MSGLLRQLRYVWQVGIACTLLVGIPFALTSALATCVASSSQADSQAVTLVAHGTDSGTGALHDDAGDAGDTSDDFEDIVEQRLSVAELRLFAAPAKLAAISACSMRGRMADGRRDKPPRAC